MPDDYNGIEYLEDNGQGALQQDPWTGKAFRSSDASAQTGASLSGPEPSFGRGSMPQGPKGIGGTPVSVPAHRAQQASQNQELTPETMLRLADQMEQDLMERTKASEGTTEVDSALIRGGNPYGGTVTPDAPDWLVQYMEGVPNAGETFGYAQASQYGGPALDKVKAKTYLSQQEMLRHLKSKR